MEEVGNREWRQNKREGMGKVKYMERGKHRGEREIEKEEGRCGGGDKENV